MTSQKKSSKTSGDHYPKLIEIPQSDFVHLRKPIDSHCFKTAGVKTRNSWTIQCFIKLFMKFTVWKIHMFTCLQIVLLHWKKGWQCQNKWCQQTSPETPQITPKHPGRLWPVHPFHPFPPLLALDFCFPLWANDLRAPHWRPAIQCHATLTASSKTWGGFHHGSLPRRLARNTHFGNDEKCF